MIAGLQLPIRITIMTSKANKGLFIGTSLLLFAPCQDTRREVDHIFKLVSAVLAGPYVPDAILR
jgi:hypothetical protein